MSVYMTEDEQIDAIKKWWSRHSTWITILVSLLLLGVSGYKYWNWHQYKIKTQASNAYEHLILAFSNENNKDIRAYSNQLINEYGQTVYADVARMTLAKLYIKKNDYNKARDMLDYVAKHSTMSAFKQIAKLRISRLFVAEKQFDKALTELSVVDDGAYMPLINELKGDIFAATGKYQQAILSYKEAMSQTRIKGMGNLFLEMKTNELASLTQSMSNDKHSLQAA
ncbi:YfgM family protein [Legionella spiritensis]|uniref:Ancillary SecYEG translocon subunit n=1 Tax=Legionella spiritensis TaxID=452 RepID=A0A0W0YYI1_LEGSP|nr:tetratricopeptide repeat protein [Legionella spiritensis]KTD61678.1 transmembrane protein [Legionella spiritensis]SNV38983.1 transmembrane protein [Legionella spiritensis]